MRMVVVCCSLLVAVFFACSVAVSCYCCWFVVNCLLFIVRWCRCLLVLGYVLLAVCCFVLSVLLVVRWLSCVICCGLTVVDRCWLCAVERWLVFVVCCYIVVCRC